MEKLSVIDRIKELIACMAWWLFLWSSDLTEDEYLSQIREQWKEDY